MIGCGSACCIVPAARLFAWFPAHKQNFPATLGNIRLLGALTTPTKLESLTFFLGKKKKDKGRPLMFEPNVLDCAYTAVHPLGIKNSSKIVFCFGSVLISQHKQAALSSFKMGEAVYY